MAPGRRDFERGIAALQGERGLDALRAFEDARAEEPENALYLSYWALANALERGRFKEAVEAAARAAERAPHVVEVHLNLGRVHLSGHDKSSAMAAFRHGLALHPNSAELVRALEELGVRRPPVFRSLGRNYGFES